MTFFVFLCTVCERFVHGFVQGLFKRKCEIFQGLRAFVHGVCAHTHTCAYMRMHKPCTPCTHSYFSFKNNGISVFKTMHKLCTNPAHCARF